MNYIHTVEEYTGEYKKRNGVMAVERKEEWYSTGGKGFGPGFSPLQYNAK